MCKILNYQDLDETDYFIKACYVSEWVNEQHCMFEREIKVTIYNNFNF